MPRPWVPPSLRAAGWEKSFPWALLVARCPAAMGGRVAPPRHRLGAPRGLGEVFASVARCQHGPEASAQVVVAPLGWVVLGTGVEPASGLSCGMWDVQDRAKGRGRLPAAQNTRKGCRRAGAGAGRVLPWGGQRSPSPSGERPELPASCRAPGVGAGSRAPMGGGVPGGASPRSPGLSPGMVWPRCGGAAPGGVCTAHTLPVSEDCRELCKHGRAPCLTAPRGESRVPWPLLGSPGPRAAGGDRGVTPGETQRPLLLHGDRGCDPQGCIS